MARFAVACLTSIAAVLLAPVIAQAQAASPPSPPPDKTVEHFGVGLVTGMGSPGALGAFRISAPATPKTAFDFDLGRIRGDGNSYGVQVRHLFLRRTSGGGSGYLLLGVSHVDLVTNTEVRWPGGVTTYLTKHGPDAIAHVGIGGDWLSRRGTRIGVEVTSGGGEWFVAFAKFFVLWGPPARTR